jgi:hypothetical protein
MRLIGKNAYLDLFLVYKHNSTFQSCGYQAYRKKYLRLIPQFNQLCSADLLNQKHFVPCDPVKYLDLEYGKSSWLTPQTTKFTWKNVVPNGEWTEQEWPRAFKYYNANGTLHLNKTLDHINKYLKFNLIRLPSDD